MAKNKIWIKKIAAGFLMLLLISITAIQLSHSHVNTTSSQDQKKDTAGTCYKSFLDSKCFICEYELARDADISLSLSLFNYPDLFNNSASESYFIILSAAHSVFENRGPPHTA